MAADDEMQPPPDRTWTGEATPLTTSRLTRDVLGVLLILLGLAGMLVCAFMAAPLLGWTLVAVAVLLAGVALALDGE